MLIFPAIDIIGGKVVRLTEGDYAQMTVYGSSPVDAARAFEAAGAACIHMVDLDGAKAGNTPNRDVVCAVARETSLFCEVGGGVRNMDVVRAYLDGGVDRVIIGTAALRDPAFVAAAVAEYGQRVAVGVDLRDGRVAIHGWTEVSEVTAEDFCADMVALGVRTVIVTDISRDGMLAGCNVALYARLQERFGAELQIVASGGVTSVEEVAALAKLGLYGAIVGKAYYEGKIDLAQAVAVAAGCGAAVAVAPAGVTPAGSAPAAVTPAAVTPAGGEGE